MTLINFIHSNFLKLIKVLILFALIVIFLLNVNIDLLKVYISFEIIIAVFFVQPLVIFSLLLSGMRLASFLSKNDKTFVSYKNGFKATILSYGFGLVLPLRLSELVKPVYLRKHCSISLSAGMAAVALERISDIVILTAFTLIGAMFFLEIDYSYLLLACCFMGLFIVLVVLFESHFLTLFEVRFTKIWQKFAFNIVRNFIFILKKKSTYIGFFFGLIAWLFSLGSLIIFFNILGVSDIGLSGYLAVFIGSIIGGAVPALPGGFGIYEASVVYFLGKYGYGFDAAIILAIGLHLSQLIFSVIATIYLSLFGKLGISSIISEIRSLGFQGSKNSKK